MDKEILKLKERITFSIRGSEIARGLAYKNMIKSKDSCFLEMFERLLLDSDKAILEYKSYRGSDYAYLKALRDTIYALKEAFMSLSYGWYLSPSDVEDLIKASSD